MSQEGYGTRSQPPLAPGKPNHEDLNLIQQERPSSLPVRLSLCWFRNVMTYRFLKRAFAFVVILYIKTRGEVSRFHTYLSLVFLVFPSWRCCVVLGQSVSFLVLLESTDASYVWVQLEASIWLIGSVAERCSCGSVVLWIDCCFRVVIQNRGTCMRVKCKGIPIWQRM